MAKGFAETRLFWQLGYSNFKHSFKLSDRIFSGLRSIALNFERAKSSRKKVLLQVPVFQIFLTKSIGGALLQRLTARLHASTSIKRSWSIMRISAGGGFHG